VYVFGLMYSSRFCRWQQVRQRRGNELAVSGCAASRAGHAQPPYLGDLISKPCSNPIVQSGTTFKNEAHGIILWKLEASSENGHSSTTGKRCRSSTLAFPRTPHATCSTTKFQIAGGSLY